MKLNKIFKGVASFGLGAGILLSSGCVPTHQGTAATVRINKKQAQTVAKVNDALVNCATMSAKLNFFDTDKKYQAQSIVTEGTQCLISFDPKDFDAAKLQSRGYVIYLYQNSECIATFYSAPHIKPFFSSTC